MAARTKERKGASGGQGLSPCTRVFPAALAAAVGYKGYTLLFMRVRA